MAEVVVVQKVVEVMLVMVEGVELEMVGGSSERESVWLAQQPVGQSRV